MLFRSLFTTKLIFLGHIISGSGIKPDPHKTDRVAAWPQPTTTTNVRGFLGLTRYIATFLPALAEYTSVLTPLTTKECDQRWSSGFGQSRDQVASSHMHVVVTVMQS